jgi:hypothetical protein
VYLYYDTLGIQCQYLRYAHSGQIDP